MRARLRGLCLAGAALAMPLGAPAAKWVDAPAAPPVAPKPPPPAAAPAGPVAPAAPIQRSSTTPTTPAIAPATPPTAPGAATASAEDIRDIRPPKPIARIWPWLALAGAIVAAAFLAWLAWRKFRPRRVRTLSPEELALARLAGALRWLSPDHAREFCYEVSEAVRGYIEQRFNVLAPRRTTEEFLRDILGSPDAQLTGHRETLSEFMGHCDLAKFAGWRFSVPEMEAMHASARAFVTVTSDAAHLAGHSISEEPQPPAAVAAGAQAA